MFLLNNTGLLLLLIVPRNLTLNQASIIILNVLLSALCATNDAFSLADGRNERPSQRHREYLPRYAALPKPYLGDN